MKKRSKAAKKLDVDLSLLILTPLVFLSGIILFLASPYVGIPWLDYDTWMEMHAISSIPIFYFSIKHVIDHWNWYKTNYNSIDRKTIDLWILSVLFSLSALTGFIIFFFSGENSLQWLIDTHTAISGVTAFYVIQHIVKYFSTIKKWASRRVRFE